MRGEGVSANGQLCARLHNTNAQQNTKQMNTQAWQKLTVQQCNSNHKTIGLRACKSDAWVTTGANNAVATKTNRHLLTWRQCWLLTTTPIPKNSDWRKSRKSAWRVSVCWFVDLPRLYKLCSSRHLAPRICEVLADSARCVRPCGRWFFVCPADTHYQCCRRSAVRESLTAGVNDRVFRPQYCPSRTSTTVVHKHRC